MKVDREQYSQLESLDPSGTLERELLTIFLHDTQDDLVHLEEEPRVRAHRIKGRSSQLGFLDLTDAATTVQLACDSQSSIENPVVELKAKVKEACEFVEDKLLNNMQ